ncbi:MAG: histidinol dehydrogenase [Cytophagales bacterium]|nr:histidinol dehydrogenase [Cytophagales bacterium]
MKIIKYPSANNWAELLMRPNIAQYDVSVTVREILQLVRLKGDRALYEYNIKYEKCELASLLVSHNEIETAGIQLSAHLKTAINTAYDNIYKFHTVQKKDIITVDTMPGVTCMRKQVAIQKVGLYVPGGSAPLFSTVLMLGVPAQIAGCQEIVLCTPPDSEGNIHPAILYCAQRCGISNIYKVGGAQAIAAMAYGTESIIKTDKIFGPGNMYVTLAKQQVLQDGIAIDMPAGPSEVLVIADATANPAFVAADLLSQAEHGPDSQVVLISDNEPIIEQVIAQIKEQLSALPRGSVAQKALQNSMAILVENMDTAMQMSNVYAPEHLILATSNAHAMAEQVTQAGSVFIGHYSPEAVGDYASGTNHTLPTHGYASAYSGVSVDSFVKNITFQHISREGLVNIGQVVMTMAEAEGLHAHANAVKVRLK